MAAAPITKAPSVSTGGPGSPEAERLALQLRTLAEEPMLADRAQQLETLAEALSRPDPAAGWDGVSLHNALGHPIPPEAAQSRFATQLGAVRVALVFVPLAVTWAGVSWAGWLYQRELARSPELGPQSLFRLWLTGFDGAMPSFHVMAIIVAVAVFGIIALTVLIARQEARAGEQRRQMQAMLNGLLTESEVQLAVSRTGSPERFEAALTRTANDLSALAAELRSAAEIATTAMEGAVAATDAARGAADLTGQGAASLAASTSGLTSKVSDLQLTVEQLRADQECYHDDLSRQLDEDRDQLGLRMGEHEQEIRKLLPELIDRIADAQTAALDSHLTELRKTLAELARQQEALATAVDALQRSPMLRQQKGRLAGPAVASGGAPSAIGRTAGLLQRFFRR